RRARQKCTPTRKRARRHRPAQGHAASEKGGSCRQQSRGLGASLIDEARRQERATATERAAIACRPPAAHGAVASIRAEPVDVVPKPAKHIDRCAQVLWLEVGIEGVAKEGNLAHLRALRVRVWHPCKDIATPG